MADAFTDTAAVTLDQAAYDLLIRYPLRSELIFDQIADVMPTRQSMVGSSVIFQRTSNLAVSVAPLSETVDVDAVALSNTPTTVTLAEYGNAMISTAKLRGTTMIPVQPIMANNLGYNAGEVMDTLAFNVLVAGANVIYGGAVTSRVTVAAGTTITSNKIRQILATMKEANVVSVGGFYNAFIHPRVEYDLRSEVGAAAWRDPHVYSQPGEIWRGEIGAYEGFRFMTSPRVVPFVNAGVGGTVDVYPTLFTGREALAKAWSMVDGNGPHPQVVISPTIDKLRRQLAVGWYWLGGFGRFRDESLWRLETSSSIGAN